MFTFKSIHADSLKVVVNKLPPFKTAQKLIRTYPIEGSDKTEVEELGFQSYVLPCQFTLMDLTELDDVKAWLSGSGVLIRDDDANKFVNASIYSEVEIQKDKTIALGSCEFFIANPFRYLLNETDVTITAPTNILNLGTYYSEPLLHITGSGFVNVTVGDTSFTYDFDTDTEVYIDSAIQEAYLGSTLKNRQMTGSFPILNVGSNSISWTGTVTSIVITQRTRFV